MNKLAIIVLYCYMLYSASTGLFLPRFPVTYFLTTIVCSSLQFLCVPYVAHYDCMFLMFLRRLCSLLRQVNNRHELLCDGRYPVRNVTTQSIQGIPVTWNDVDHADSCYVGVVVSS